MTSLDLGRDDTDGPGMPGTLYLVATPIGNLEDITFRAVRTLREVRLIAAEDTRRTGRLLRHYGVSTPAVSLHDHNERRRTPGLVKRLLEGDSIALLSDAGTPLVSDPGFDLVRQSLDAGVRVTSIPGPSAVIAALVSCGAPVASFSFLGFPPRGLNDRKRWCDELAREHRTLVFFEAPHRLVTTLGLLDERLGGRTVALCRELTKLHESTLVGPVASLLPSVGKPRGEYTCVVWPADRAADVPPPPPDGPELLDELDRMTHGAGSRRDAVRALAAKYGRSSRAMYQALEEAKGETDP